MSAPRIAHSAKSDSLALVERLLSDATRTPGRLGDAAAYLLERPGKRVRARLCLKLAESL